MKFFPEMYRLGLRVCPMSVVDFSDFDTDDDVVLYFFCRKKKLKTRYCQVSEFCYHHENNLKNFNVLVKKLPLKQKLSAPITQTIELYLIGAIC